VILVVKYSIFQQIGENEMEARVTILRITPNFMKVSRAGQQYSCTNIEYTDATGQQKDKSVATSFLISQPVIQQQLASAAPGQTKLYHVN
jgi:hypothetical protein